jgi:hypothetical protein
MPPFPSPGLPPCSDKVLEALRACEAYFEERADAEYFPDSAGPVGNEEMRLLVEVQAAIANLPNEVAA